MTGHRPGRRGVWDLLGAGLQRVLGKRLRDYDGPRAETTEAFGRKVMKLCAVNDPRDPSWLRLLSESVDAGVTPERAAAAWQEAKRNRAMWAAAQEATAPPPPTPTTQLAPASGSGPFLPGVPVTIERIPSPGGGWGTPASGEAVYDFPGDVQLFDAWERLALYLEQLARQVRQQKGIAQNWMPDYPESGVMEAVRHMIKGRDEVLEGLNAAADQLRSLCKANAEYVKSCKRRG